MARRTYKQGFSLLSEIAQMLWADAWNAYHWNVLGRDPKARPPAPPAAHQAAKDLEQLYEHVNDESLDEIARRIETANQTQWTNARAKSKYKGGWPTHAEPMDNRHLAAALTDYAVRGPLGADTHFREIWLGMRPRIKVPTFSVSYDGKEFSWEGSDAQRNPSIPSQEEYLGETLGAPEVNPGGEEWWIVARGMNAPWAAMVVRQKFGIQGYIVQSHGWLIVPTTRAKAFEIVEYIEERAKAEGGMGLQTRPVRRAEPPGADESGKRRPRKNPACPACGAHIAAGATSCPACGIRVHAGAEGVATPLESPRQLTTRRGRPPGVPHANPSNLTAKGERMYEDIKRGYGHDPRAKEIAARTVLARSHEVPGLVKHNPGAYVRVGRMPTDAELASAWRYIDAEFRFDPDDVVDGEQWAEGLAFGQYEGTSADREAVAEMKPQLTEVQWRQIAYRADHLRADQGLAPKFKE